MEYRNMKLIEIGLALHTVQDCQVHQGRRWDMGIANRVKALKMKMQDNHPDLGCTFSKNSDEAEKMTKLFVDIILKNQK